MGLETFFVETEDDLLSIISLKQADDLNRYSKTLSEDEALEQIISLAQQGYHFFITRENDAVIGYALGLLDSTGAEYRCVGLYVTPKYKNSSAGYELKKLQKDFAEFSLGCDRIWGVLNKQDMLSIAASKQSGFTLYEDQSNPGILIEEYVPNRNSYLHKLLSKHN